VPAVGSQLRSTRWAPLLIGGASLVGAIAVWWLVVWIWSLPDHTLPSPNAIASHGYLLWTHGALWPNIKVTLYEILKGLVIGTALGLILAALFFRSRVAERLLMPVIVVAQVTPKISIAPLIVLWLGLGQQSKVALVALVSFYPIMVNVVTRLRGLPQSLDHLATIVGLRGIRRALRLELPYSFPAIIAGLKVGVLAAVTAAVIGELLGSNAGLGFLESQGEQNDDMKLVIIALILFCLLGWALYAIVSAVERRVTKRFGE
jgi:NitT/TauT family transport system permease protein